MTDPRALAIANLAKVVDGRSLDAVLADADQLEALDGQQRPFAAELSYGLCRWYRQLHAIVAGRLQKPLRERDRDVHHVLMLGVWQLLHGRMPEHAAIDSCVRLTHHLDKAWASKLVNAVLRRVQRESADPGSDLAKLLDSDPSIRFAQPKWFVRAMQRAWPQQYLAILDALQQRAPMTLRLNTSRMSQRDYLAQLSQQGIGARALPAVPGALVLDSPLPVGTIPGFEQGLVSVQDAAAQLAARLLDVRPGQRVLDACAAPGGKTGHLLELAGRLRVTAVDVDARRLERVSGNLRRLGLQAELLAADASEPPAQWLETGFDRILLDAPCSATGVMRRHPDIRLLRRASDIGELAQRQSALLEALWPCLLPGGKLLYATCSLMPQENHLQVQAFLQQHSDAQVLPMQGDWGHDLGSGRQTLPGEHTMDGFFYALMEKVSG